MFVLVPVSDEESVRIEARLIPRPRPPRRGDVRPIRFRRANAFLKMGRNQLPPKVGRTLIPAAGSHRSTDRSLLRTD